MLPSAAAAAPLGAAILPISTPTAPSLDIAAAESQFLDLLNADRVANNLAPLQPDPRLMEVARWRSEDMVARNFFGHDLGGYTVNTILRDRQISFRLAGENLAVNTYDETRAVDIAESGLMASAGHRDNILRPEFNLVGVGIAVTPDGKIVFTQIFIQS